MDISLVNKMVSGYLLLKASLSDARPTKKKQLNLKGESSLENMPPISLGIQSPSENSIGT